MHHPKWPTAAVDTGVAVGVVANTLMLGALLLQVAKAVCAGLPWAGGRLARAMLAAAGFQIAALVVQGVVLPRFASGSPRNTMAASVQAWLQATAVLIMAYICYRRALAIGVARPWVPRVAKALTVTFCAITLFARAASFSYELDAFTGAAMPDAAATTTVLRLWARFVINMAALVFLAFMETYVTSVIVQYRYRAVDAGAVPSSSAVATGRRRKKTESPRARPLRIYSARLRIVYSAVILVLFLAQGVLQVVNLVAPGVPSPLYLVGWSLVLYRILIFREELVEPLDIGASNAPSRLPQRGEPPAARPHTIEMRRIQQQARAAAEPGAFLTDDSAAATVRAEDNHLHLLPPTLPSASIASAAEEARLLGTANRLSAPTQQRPVAARPLSATTAARNARLLSGRRPPPAADPMAATIVVPAHPGLATTVIARSSTSSATDSRTA
ncbi:hypothetical protein H9P43_002941 [Blastocladiella emersonii ATCC 22665]|nr:hypothetical protein H9P43_002941 [Blastocladiella emersonii ATCC 22665]